MTAKQYKNYKPAYLNYVIKCKTDGYKNSQISTFLNWVKQNIKFLKENEIIRYTIFKNIRAKTDNL